MCTSAFGKGTLRRALFSSRLFIEKQCIFSRNYKLISYLFIYLVQKIYDKNTLEKNVNYLYDWDSKKIYFI